MRAAVLLFAVSMCAAGTPSVVCRTCHREIYDAYSRTPMAVSAGKPGTGLIRESFDRSRFEQRTYQYRVSKWFFEYGDTRRPLAWFIGSGAIARSYLIEKDGFLYQAPVAYYSASAKWGLAPGYDTYAYPYLTRPIPPGCLTCHASFLDPAPGTQNGYRNPPFREGGVACERCHGPGEAHIRAGGRAGIVNPAKLDPVRRDSICAQCHLTGEARVMRPGRDWRSFQPGDPLSDSMTVFVRAGAARGMRVTSHVEKLAQSACRQRAGARMWCGTCHDPHRLPEAGERAAWFRAKCSGCHAPDACTATSAARRANRDDCVACHMPKNPVTDAQHVVNTDHSIPRRPLASDPASGTDAELVAFDGFQASDRDRALAYAMVGQRRRNPDWLARARRMLEQAAEASPDDVEVLLYLAELYRNSGENARAIPLYERAARLDPSQVTASVGLGGIRMQRGEYREAIRLWQDALAKNPGLVLVGANMALAQWRIGDKESARTTLETAAGMNPGFSPPVELLERLRKSPEY